MKRMIVKLLLFIIFVASFAFAIFADAPVLTVNPPNPLKGQKAQIEISSDEGVPELIELPPIEGIRWIGRVGQYSQTEIINFKVSTRHTVTYEFSVEKEGEIKFPQLKLKVGKKKIALNSFVINAVPPKISGSQDSADSGESIEKYIFAKAYPLSNKMEFFVGEEIPFEIAVFCASGIKAEYSWPEIEVQDITFKDFSSINKDNAKFSGYSSGSEGLNGRTFNVYRFRTVFRGMRHGSIEGAVRVNSRIVLPKSRGEKRRSSRFSDSFFEEFFGDPFAAYEKITHVITCQMPEIKILSLPEAPNGANFIGLIGDWNLNFALSSVSDKIKVGESFTLKVLVDGRGGLDNLRLPELNIEGFRVYPPELIRNSSVDQLKESASIEYVMVPLKEGEITIDLNFTTFSTEKREYQNWTYSKRISPLKSDENIPQTIIAMENAVKTKSKKNERIKEKLADILYLKRGNLGAISIPIWTNRLLITALIALSGLILFLISELADIFRRKKMDPVLLRRESALSKKRKILRKISSLNRDSLDVFVREEFCPWLNDIKGFPPGTSPEEIADKLDDDELVSLIEDSARFAYMPGSSKIGFEQKQNILISTVKKLASFIIFISFITLTSASELKENNAIKIGKISPFELYDKGLFSEAAAEFSSELSKSQNDPHLLYNIGCCLYRSGLFPEALYFFEKANMLAPRDSDIKENMNHLRRKLGLEVKEIADSPTQILLTIRDMLRPDEWLMISALFFSFFFVLLSFRRKISVEFLWASLFITATFSLIAIFATLSQLTTSYGREQAMIMTRAAQIHVLPLEDSPKAGILTKEGQRVKLVEERSEWSRIRLDNGEGWVKNEFLKKFWD